MNLKKYIALDITEIIVGAIILVFVGGLVGGSRLSRLSNSKAIYSEEPVGIYLKESKSLEELSTMLADSGLVDSRNELMWAGKLLGWRNFNPGHYEIDGGYSYDVFLSRLARGIQDPVEITILPGQTEDRIAESLIASMEFDSTALYNTLSDSLFLEEIGVQRKKLIGRLFPNTYSIYWTSSPEAVIKRVLKEFDKAVYENYKQRFEELDRSVNEIVTLASIIEWEATHEEEKATISGLYWNRLRRGMRLQADPTVNYAINERRRLLYQDYEVDHPYNTYKYRGLPPGPITNPSLSSIEAALFPSDHDYLYMVASPEGYHVFSETFEEHKEHSEKWRQWLREQYRIKRQKEAENSDDVSS